MFGTDRENAVSDRVLDLEAWYSELQDAEISKDRH